MSRDQDAIFLKGFIQASDPGAVGAQLFWFEPDVTDVFKIRNAQNTAWDTVGAGVVGSVPTGTGFVHVTAGVQDAAAALVVNADVDAAAAIAQSKIFGLVTDLAGKQPVDATLTALAAANWAANAFPIGSGADTLSQVTFAANTFPARASSGNLVAKAISDFALTILDDADAATVRATIGVGTGTGDALVANPLSQFAATSSLQLIGVISDETGTGLLVFNDTPTLIAPLLGTPTSGVLTNCTGLPIGSGVSGLGTGVATFLGTASSANLLAALTTKTGTGLAVFGTSPSITTGILDANGLPLLAFIATASAVYGFTFANAALLGTVALGVTAPTQVADSVAGTPLSFRASDAVAGASNVGAAAGGSITHTTGAAARNTSGNANGGNHVFVTGAGIGTGTAGVCVFPDGVQAAPSIVFSSSTTTGFYRNGSNSLAYAVAGAAILQMFNTGISFASTMFLQWSSNTNPQTTADLLIGRAAAATLQLGAANVNGSAVAQILRVQSAVTGTDQAAANFTIQGSRQTGAGTTGQIIFQTSPKLATGTTQGSYVTALTLTAPAVNMNPSVVIGNQALVTTATDGFLYIPTCAGTPTGVPTTFTGRVALIYDTTNFQFWIYDGAWKQPKTPAGAALVTWQ